MSEYIPCYNILLDGTMAEVDISGSWSVNDERGFRIVYHNGNYGHGKTVWCMAGRLNLNEVWNGKVVKINKNETIEVDPIGYREKYIAKEIQALGYSNTPQTTKGGTTMTNKEKIDATVALGASLGWVPVKNGKVFIAGRCSNKEVVNGKKVCGGMTAIPFRHTITGSITAKCFACGTRS